VPAELDLRGDYVDLWMALAAVDPRTTCAGVKGSGEFTGCALVEGDDAVFVQPGALYPTPGPGGQALADAAQRHVEQWLADGRPKLTDWTSALAERAAVQPQPLLYPTAWQR
jgi:protein-L-isoaspartate(D-aspartate) O-methyltransferase